MFCTDKKRPVLGGRTAGRRKHPGDHRKERIMFKNVGRFAIAGAALFATVSLTSTGHAAPLVQAPLYHDTSAASLVHSVKYKRGYYGKRYHRGFHKRSFYKRGFHGRSFHGKGFHGHSFHGKGFKSKGFGGKKGFHGKKFHGKGFHGGFHGKGFKKY